MIMWFIWIVPVDHVMTKALRFDMISHLALWRKYRRWRWYRERGNTEESQCGSQVSTNVSCKYDFIGKNTAQTKDHGTTLYTGGFHCFTVCGYESLENQISVSSSPQSCGSQGSVVLLWLAAALTVTSGAQYARALRQSKLLVDCSVFVQFRDGKTNKENLPGESTCCSEFQKV